MKNHKKYSSSVQSGWATLELVMSLPLIAGLIALIFYFGQLSFLRLHLTSVTDAAARIAAIKDCSAGKSYVQQSISGLNSALDVHCSGGEYVTMEVKTVFHSPLPFFDSIQRPIAIKAVALNEHIDTEN